MSESDIETFEEFWDYYVAQHSEKATRILHFIGTTAAIGCLAGGLLTKRRWLLVLAPIVGYGPAWVGHFFVEKNKPATFTHPIWSLRADFVMWWKMVRGEMQAEVDRVAAKGTTTPDVDGEPVSSHAVNSRPTSERSEERARATGATEADGRRSRAN